MLTTFFIIWGITFVSITGTFLIIVTVSNWLEDRRIKASYIKYQDRAREAL